MSLEEQSSTEVSDSFSSETYDESESSKKIKGKKTMTDQQKYNALVSKIARDQEKIHQLEAENESLKAAIRRAEKKIKQYPETKRRYDILSSSLNLTETKSSKKRTNSPI